MSPTRQSLKDRYGPWALVVGGTSGIGRALAEQLAAEGLALALVARDAARLQAEARALGDRHGVEIRPIEADLSQPDGVGLVTRAVEDLEIGLLVPGAAVESRGPFVDSPMSAQQRLLQLNCAAPMQLAHHFGRAMARRGRGGILFISSLSGWSPQPTMAHYGASKAYILSLGEALHHELASQGVDVAVLSPGPTDTPMIADIGVDFAAMGMTVMKPADVAAAGLATLGRRAGVVPGLRNALLAFLVSRVLPRRWVALLFHHLLGRARQNVPATT
jgi:short-subunit dehydrogenase